MKTKFVNNRLIETTDRFIHINWLFIYLVIFAGFVVVGSLGYGFFRGTQLYQKYFPLTDASMEMRLEATTAYLWFEEMLGGDKSKNMDEILKHLDQADWYARAMIDGGESAHLKLVPLREYQIRESIISLQNQLKRQRDLLNKRITAIHSSGPGSKIDAIYHETLEEFLKNANNLEMKIKSIMFHDYKIFKYICLGLISFCILLFLFLGFRFYRYERLRLAHYTEILQMERLLVQSEKMAALGTMITGVAHEINNPNNFISFNIPILKEYLQNLMPIVDDYAQKNPDYSLFNMSYQEFREDLHKLLENIENGSIRIDNIVSDLKTFAQKRIR